MSRWVYVNGRYVGYASAAVHVEDRGFQFGDSVYEVCEVRAGVLIDERRHLDRLERSLGELAMPMPMARRALQFVVREVVRRNRVTQGSIYLQVSRGAARRDFVFPDPATPPTLVCVARHARRSRLDAAAAAGIAVVTAPDIRWQRRDIKTTMLLPACLAKEQARASGAREAWYVDEAGFITEGASSNAWIVTSDGVAVTRRADNGILAGVTRATLMDCLAAEGIRVEERPFRVAEAIDAREAFITSASNTVMPVVSVDGHRIAGGVPGALTLRLRERFHHFAAGSARLPAI